MSIKGDVLPGGINQEIQGVTTQTRAHPDDFNPNVLKPLLDNDVTMSKQLETLPSEALTFRPGYQIVESEQDTPFRLGEIKGRTLVNLLGRAGACDNLSLIGGYRGTNAIENGRLKLTIGNDTGAVAFIGISGVIKAGKYYLLAGVARNGSSNVAALAFGGSEGGGPSKNTTRKTEDLLYMTKHADRDLNDVNIDIVVYGTEGQYGYFDDIRLYEITEAEAKVIDSMTPEQVAEKYPYVDSMTNVKNPYAIVTGGNLLPPFYEWRVHSVAAVVEPYTLLSRPTMSAQATEIFLPVIKGAVYTLSYETNDANTGYMNWAWVDSSGATLSWTPPHKLVHTEKAPPNAVRLRVIATSINAGTFTFRSPVLTIGTDPKPFAPQQRSLLAFETEFAAHPIDGSNPDTLFFGDDGLPYVLEQWGVFSFEKGKSYGFYKSSTGFKCLLIGGGLPDDRNKDVYPYVCKYDGTLLKAGAPSLEPEEFSIINWTAGNDGKLGISVINTDSGWGPDYTPTGDEIKAYFLGWRLSVLGQPRETIYNGAGEKVWIRLDRMDKNKHPTLTSGVDYFTTVPNFQIRVSEEWQPYRLQYLKAKPTVEPVRNYELGATLTAGSNMVEVGSGIVIREKANPVYYSPNGNYYINNTGVSGSLLKNKVSLISRVYRNDQVDSFAKSENDANAYGKQHIRFLSSDFDPTAVYRVTYTMLDPTLPAPISGTVAANLRGTVTELVQDVGDVERRLSVVENHKTDTIEDTGWIPVTPLNGWTHYPNKNLHFRVLGNRLYLRGMIQDGQGAVKTIMFYLPVKTHYGVWEKVATWSDSTNVKIMQVNFTPSGNMVINSGSALKYVSFDGLVFEFDRLELV
ncbi:hypothetical protein [Paenibacillus thiaminolyticus]|uniref:Uncharacterized protein n=1 Tax=Paenibacillus thiaminolyticus TaxID=49283 RepID=A0A3A3GHN8_PANTH|nr:hypothetical protein [Paenibacillus thiaminolyticus]RJG23382.1 hypothetical protein DQX05_14160 [Paenibacillus thiaminolyticus]